MKVAVIGLGVGYALSCAIAEAGLTVTGIDTKLEVVRNPRRDKSVDMLLVKAGDNIKRHLSLTTEMGAVKESDVTVICVSTGDEKKLILGHVECAMRQCLTLLRSTGRKNTILVYSTLPYGSSKRIRELFSQENVQMDKQVCYCYMPLMIAQGTTVNDFVNPPFIAFGAYSQETAIEARDFYLGFMRKSILFKGKVPPNFVTTPEIAEMAKLVANAFLSTKISYANMVARFCERNRLNGAQLLEIVGSDWRIGSAMLRPGFAFGGACFPRDLESLIVSFQETGTKCEILEAVRKINVGRTEDPLEVIASDNLGRRVLVLGTAYKLGLQDTRGSPSLSLIEALCHNGYAVEAYDPNIDASERLEKVMKRAYDVAIVSTAEPSFKSIGLWCKRTGIRAVLDYANLVETSDLQDDVRLFKSGIGWIN